MEGSPVAEAFEHVIWPALSALTVVTTALIGGLAWLFNLSGRMRSVEDRQADLRAWLERVETKLDRALTGGS